MHHAYTVGEPLLIAEQRLAEALEQVGQKSKFSTETLRKFAAELVLKRPGLGQATIAYQHGYARELIAQQTPR